MRSSRIALLSSLIVASVACRSSSSNSTADGSGGGDAAAFVKIQDIQSDTMPVGTKVSVQGVVVTAIDNYGAKTGDIWVEEPEGGAFSGVHVYNAPVAIVATLSVGDIVTITGGVKAEFALASDTSGRTLTEIEPPMGGMLGMTKTGTGTVPAPQVIDALAIGQMSDPARSNEWEKWEGVLVTMTNVSALSVPTCVGSACSDPLLQNFGITGVAKAESSLAAFPTGIARDQCLASLTGVVDYFFDYLVLPRSTTEVMTGGTACPASENSHALCTDSLDNDGNGYLDCGDDNCMINDVATCDTTRTIAAINMAASAPTGGTRLVSVRISAIASNGQDFWVSDNSASGQYQGIYVYGGGQALPTGAVVGKGVNMIVKSSDYNNDTTGNALREVEALTVMPTGGPPGSMNPLVDPPIASITTDMSYVGVLMQFSHVKLTMVANPANYNIAQVTFQSTAVEVTAPIHVMTPTAPTCYATLTGIWTYDVFNNVFAFAPIAEGPPGTGC